MPFPGKGFGWMLLALLALDLAVVQFVWMPPVIPQTLTALFLGGLVWGWVGYSRASGEEDQ